MLVMFFCIAILVTAFLPGIPLSQRLCDISCLCWWINPHFHIGSWYDFGSGFGVNAIVNGFIGDAVLNSFAVRHVAGKITRTYFARREPTQHLMDEAVRSRDPYYLPWRIVHVVKIWFFAVTLWPVVPLVGIPALAYYLVSFVIDRSNLLSQLEPVPPSSGLCMRFVLSCLMPAAVPLHLVVAFTGYVAKLRDPASGRHVSLIEALEDPRLIFFLFFSIACVSAMLFDMFVIQTRRARRRGLLTPWEVCKAALQADHGFSISSRAEPFPEAEATLDDLPPDMVHTLYRPPFLTKGADVRDEGVQAAFLFQSSEQGDRGSCACRNSCAATAKAVPKGSRVAFATSPLEEAQDTAHSAAAAAALDCRVSSGSASGSPGGCASLQEGGGSGSNGMAGGGLTPGAAAAISATPSAKGALLGGEDATSESLSYRSLERSSAGAAPDNLVSDRV